jgi:hypothetical protein
MRPQSRTLRATAGSEFILVQPSAQVGSQGVELRDDFLGTGFFQWQQQKDLVKRPIEFWQLRSATPTPARLERFPRCDRSRTHRFRLAGPWHETNDSVLDSRNGRLWNGHCLQTDAAGRNYFADKSFRLTDGPLSGSIADFGLDWAAPLPMPRPRWLPTRQFPFLYTKRIGGPPRWLPIGLIGVHMAAALARLPWVELALAALKRKKMSSEAGSRIALVTKGRDGNRCCDRGAACARDDGSRFSA